MNIFPTAARLRFTLWAGLAAGLVGTGTLAPSPIHNASSALTALGAPDPALCSETLFTGFPAIATSATSLVDEQLTSLACADGGCVDPESVSSQPAAGERGDDSLPELGEEIPVLASLAPMPDIPGLGDPDVTDDPNWMTAGQQAGQGGAGPGGKGGSNGSGGNANGGGGHEEYVLLPGTGGFIAPPSNGGGGHGSNGGAGEGSDSGSGGGSTGGGGGSGGGGFGGGGSGGGGVVPTNGGGNDDDDDDKLPVQRLAAIGDAPAEVPAPATISLLGLGLVALARSKR